MSEARPRSRLESAGIVAKGFCMGTADVIPGVSGGTMALILGIYERLLQAIRSFDLRALALLRRFDVRGLVNHLDLALLVPLAVGIFAALMFFTRVIPLPKLILSDPEPVFAFFFGLIVGSVIVLLRGLEGLGATDWLCLLLGTAAGFLVVNLVPVSTPESSWFIVLTGAIAISALILPGISGSFILLIMKKYAYIFDAISRFDFSVIIPFAVGAAIGLMGFSRLLVWLLGRFHQKTLVSIVGVLVGSLWVIWPFQNRVYETVRHKPRLISSEPFLPSTLDGSILSAVALMVVGFATVLAVSAVASRRARAGD